MNKASLFKLMAFGSLAFAQNALAGISYQLEIQNLTSDTPITIKKVWYKHKNSSWEVVNPWDATFTSWALTFEPQECTGLVEDSWTGTREQCRWPSTKTAKTNHYNVWNVIGTGSDTHYWKAQISVAGYGEKTIEGRSNCAEGFNRCTSKLYFDGRSVTIGQARYPLYFRESFDRYERDEQLNAQKQYSVSGATFVPSDAVVSPDYDSVAYGNNGFELDGVDDYIRIEDEDRLDFGPDDDFTVSVWVNAQNYQPSYNKIDNAIVEKWSGSGGYPYVIRFLNLSGKVRVARYDGTNNPKIDSNASILSGGYSSPDGYVHGWKHIEFTKLGKQLKLYINGVLQGVTTDTTTGNTKNSSPLYVGRRGGSLPIHFSGEVDELRVYPYAATEMKNMQTIRSKGYDATCMGPTSTAQGSQVKLHVNNCDEDTHIYTVWKYDPATGYIHLGSNMSMCMAKEGSSSDWSNGKIVHLWPCSDGAVQNKSWIYDSSTGIIRARYNSQKCMHKRDAGWASTNRIHVWSDCSIPRENNAWILRDF